MLNSDKVKVRLREALLISTTTLCISVAMLGIIYLFAYNEIGQYIGNILTVIMCVLLIPTALLMMAFQKCCSPLYVGVTPDQRSLCAFAIMFEVVILLVSAAAIYIAIDSIIIAVASLVFSISSLITIYYVVQVFRLD